MCQTKRVHIMLRSKSVRTALVVLIAIGIAGQLHAQAVGPDTAARNLFRFGNPTARKVADYSSTVLVIVGLVAPCLDNRTWYCVKNEGLQVGTAALTSEIAKYFIHRTRPDGSDNKSFFSEHSAIVCAATLNTRYWELCPVVMIERMDADKHYLTDTLGGLTAAVMIKVTVVW